MALTVEELITRTQGKIETAKTLLDTKRTQAEAARTTWMTLEENCRKIEQQIAEWEALVTEARVAL
jgi:phage shock protein A